MGLSLPVTEGVGFSPSVNKPLAVTKGEREEDPSLPFLPLATGESGLREATLIDIPPH